MQSWYAATASRAMVKRGRNWRARARRIGGVTPSGASVASSAAGAARASWSRGGGGGSAVPGGCTTSTWRGRGGDSGGRPGGVRACLCVHVYASLAKARPANPAAGPAAADGVMVLAKPSPRLARPAAPAPAPALHRPSHSPLPSPYSPTPAYLPHVCHFDQVCVVQRLAALHACGQVLK